jgi:Tol biopolymer transport system component/DNA-binding winged helix-turn-helix (wHTH) protein
VVEPAQPGRLITFSNFEVDLHAGELRKAGKRLKLSGQPFQVLSILLERAGDVVTREELQKRLWPATFVDVDHSLNTAINKIREVLGDSAESPRFLETLPKRGYRFVASVNEIGSEHGGSKPRHWLSIPIGLGIAATLAFVSAFVWILAIRHSTPIPREPVLRNLMRATFDDGLQAGPTWSPDGRFIAYSSDRSGMSQIWVQQVSGGDPVQITRGPHHNWQPEWSPDGKYIAYRSEASGGGLFVVPALGGAGLERKITLFGYYPHWSPDGSQLLFQSGRLGLDSKLYLVGIKGSSPREVMADVTSQNSVMSAAWHPDGKRITVWAWELFYRGPIPRFWTGGVDGGSAVQTQLTRALSEVGDVVAGTANIWEDSDFRFAWAPSGTAIYFERTFHGARNIWRMSIDPESLQAASLEQLTTSAGLDSEPALSPNGRKLAFTTKSESVRTWIFPFDLQHGKIIGDGHPVTSPSMEAWDSSISSDGRYLVSSVKRDGKWELWEKSLPDGSESPVLADDSYFRGGAIWSPDGTQLAYVRSNFSSSEFQRMTWSRQDRLEHAVSPRSSSPQFVFDWSLSGDWLLTSQTNTKSFYADVWMVPVHENTGQSPRKVITGETKRLPLAGSFLSGRTVDCF